MTGNLTKTITKQEIPVGLGICTQANLNTKVITLACTHMLRYCSIIMTTCGELPYYSLYTSNLHGTWVFTNLFKTSKMHTKNCVKSTNFLVRISRNCGNVKCSSMPHFEIEHWKNQTGKVSSKKREPSEHEAIYTILAVYSQLQAYILYTLTNQYTKIDVSP